MSGGSDAPPAEVHIDDLRSPVLSDFQQAALAYGETLDLDFTVDGVLAQKLLELLEDAVPAPARIDDSLTGLGDTGPGVGEREGQVADQFTPFVEGACGNEPAKVHAVHDLFGRVDEVAGVRIPIATPDGAGEFASVTGLEEPDGGLAVLGDRFGLRVDLLIRQRLADVLVVEVVDGELSVPAALRCFICLRRSWKSAKTSGHSVHL